MQKQSFKISQENSSEKLHLQGDKLSLSNSVETTKITYNSDLSFDEVQSRAYDQLRSFVSQVFEKQQIDSTVNIDGNDININELGQKEAKNLIADDGYFGVEKTSSRIVDFAIALSGNDTERIDAIRSGIEKGFQEALDAFGGWLPDISHATYDAVNEKLNAWVSQSA